MQCVEIGRTLKVLHLETVKLYYSMSNILQFLWRTLQGLSRFNPKCHAFGWDCLLKGIREDLEVINE